jgi:hypothetical protein
MEKRYSHGLNLLATYTYSKMMDDSSAGNNSWLGNYTPIQDLNDLKAEWSVGASDTPQRFVVGGSYELPIGRNRALGHNWGRVLSTVLGDWQINGFLTFQSGIPLALGLAAADLADGTQRPNLIGDIRGASPREVAYGRGIAFNEAGLSVPDPQVAGTAPRFEGTVRGDGIRNLDLSLFKVLSLTERVRLQLRAEAFNVANRTQFGLPDTSFGDPAFGTISNQANSPRQMQFGARLTF